MDLERRLAARPLLERMDAAEGEEGSTQDSVLTPPLFGMGGLLDLRLDDDVPKNASLSGSDPTLSVDEAGE